MSPRRAAKLHYKYSETGKILFTEAQTKKRFQLCKEALSSDKKYTTRFKDVYLNCQDMEDNCIQEFNVPDLFTDRYFELQQRGWGGIYKNFDSKFSAPEGAFFPFTRTRFKSFTPIDQGCIWIGNHNCYPLIFVHNSIAIWLSPYSKMGFVRKEIFLPYAEARAIMPRLLNKVIYPDVPVDFA